MTKKIFIFIACIVLVVITSAAAQEQSPNFDALQDATSSGLSFLARQQQLDGSFQSGGQKLAVTGLGVLAFIENGHTSDGGKYAPTVRRAIEFLLRQTPGDRYFGRVDGSRMYGHAVVTLALCRAYGVEPDEQTRTRLRATVKDAVAILIAAQNIKKSPEDDGGWGEQRDSTDSEFTVTAWARDALLAASEIGVDVPKDSASRADAYLQRSFQKPQTASTRPAIYIFDDHYFTARRDLRASAADYARDCARLIGAQSPDGGWPAPAEFESTTRARATSLSLLTFSLRLALSPD
jgi:hypothetical protein